MQGKEGVGDIISGVIIIGLGFMFGGSVFLGHFDLWNIAWDAIGVFFLAKGIIRFINS